MALIERPDRRGLFAAIDNERTWVFHVVIDRARESAEDFPPERCAELVRDALGVDVPITIRSVLPWECASRVADRFRVGRVLLAGDSAHLMPPWGGMGANTGIADASDLAWKLAHVVRGIAGEALLDTYEAERRPVAIVAAEDSAENTGPDGLMATVSVARILGLSLAGLRGTITGGSHAPSRLQKVSGLGFQLRSSAIASEPGSPFRIDGRPGTRVPHAWVERDGARVSTLDLAAARLALIAGADADGWCARAGTLGVDVLRSGVDFVDRGDAWARAAGIGRRGALLVRPDAIVAWRARDERAMEPLEAIVERALARRVDRAGVREDARAAG